jgi:hypothetical protein
MYLLTGFYIQIGRNLMAKSIKIRIITTLFISLIVVLLGFVIWFNYGNQSQPNGPVSDFFDILPKDKYVIAQLVSHERFEKEEYNVIAQRNYFPKTENNT